MKRAVLILVLCKLSLNCPAQSPFNSVEITPTYGLKLFTPEGNHLSGALWGTEAVFHLSTYNNQAAYVHLLNLESIDAVFSYRNMEQVLLNGNPATKGLLGSTYAAMGRAEFRLVQAGPVKLLFTPGAGLLYSTQTYYTNQANTIIGSHINIAAQAGLKLNTRISGSTAIQAGLDIFHYSNGAIRLPNNGVNAFSASLGVVTDLRRQGPVAEADPPLTHRSSLEIGGDVGYRGNFVTQSGAYHKGLYLGYNYRITRGFSLKAEVDAVHSNDVFDITHFDQTFQGYASHIDRWRAGGGLGADVWLGPLAVMATYGRYFRFRTYYPNDQYYWTAGLKYYVRPWIAAQVKGYIHGTEAEYVGAGVLFRIGL